MSSLTLGDAGTPNDDESYTGEVSSSPVSLDWFRGQLRQFQAALVTADEAYQAGSAAFVLTGDEGIALQLAEYDSKAREIKSLAETLNQGAEMVNAMGGRMPVLSIPQTLGALPALVIPAVVVAAALGVGAWVSWARGFASGIVQGIDTARAAAIDANATAEVVAAIDSERAKAVRAQSTGFSLSSGLFSGTGWTLAKIAAIGGLAWLAWRSFNDVFDR
jgi:hypothetical protein